MTRKFRQKHAGLWCLAALSLICLVSVSRPAAAAATAIPYVVGVSPASAPIEGPGGSDLTLTVYGANFISSSKVVWNFAGVATTFTPTSVGNDELTVVVPGSYLTSYGTAILTVTTPGAISSNVAYLTVTNSSTSLTFRLTQQSPSGGNHPYFPVAAVFNTGTPNSPLALAVTNDTNIDATPPGVSVFAGNGNGSFQGAGNSTYSVGNNPQGLVIGDFNGDGKPDLASVDNQSATISFLQGVGDGTFLAAVTSALPPNSILASAADFNGDGMLDLAVICQGPSSNNVGFVAILLGNGDGTFQAPVTYNLGASNFPTLPAGLAVADFDGNGTLDLAVSDATNSEVWILSGKGDGTFASPGTAYATAATPASLVAADFNGGGSPDLAVAYQAEAEVSVLINSSGTFPTHAEYATAAGGLFLAAADLNGDGIMDLAVPGYQSDQVSVLLGAGDGTLGTYSSFVISPSFTSILGITTGDFNSDGRLDLAFTVGTTLNTTSDIAVLLQSPLWTPSSTSLTFANQAVGTQSSAQTITFTNTGGAPLDLRALSSTDTTNFPESNTCGHLPATFAPGAGCTVTVTFSPSVPGNLSADISIQDNITAPGSPQLIALSGTGTQPAVKLNPASLTFGNQQVGTKSTKQTVTLTNTGNGTLNITSISASGDFSETNTCGSSLSPSGSCTISVTFTPSAAGARTGSVSVIDTAPASPQTVSLSGTGTAPIASLSSTSLAFALQMLATTSGAQTVTLTNTGNANLTVSSVAASGDFAATNTCSTAVAPNGTCTISVSFKPTASGARSGVVTITDNASPTTQTISLTGTGAVLSATASPGTLTFASELVGVSSTVQNVTLTNTGTVAMNITVGAPSGDFSATHTCGSSLAASATCSVSVNFKPTVAGSRSGSLTITETNNSAAGSGSTSQTVSLSGTGAAPIASLSTLPAFTSQLLNTSAVQKVVVSNTGTWPLSVSNVGISGANAGDFTETNGCLADTVAAGSNCTVSVTFKPASAGSRNATLIVTDNASPTTQTVNLSGTGAVLAATASAASLTFSGQLVNTSSTAQTVTLTNAGTVGLTISSLAATGDFIQTNTCGSSLAASASCTVSVSFKPIAAGARSGSLTISGTNSSGGGSASSTETVSLTGTGTAPGVTLSATSLTFADQNVGTASAAQKVTVTNNGSAALTLKSIAANGDFSQTSGCGSSLAAGASCAIDVTFKPSTLFSRIGTLTVTDNASTGAQSVSLSGTGMGALGNLSASSLAFEGALVGVTSAVKNVTLTNSGNSAMTISGIAAGGDFAQSNTCASTLAVNASCTISVTFKASVAGARGGSLTLTSSAVGSPETVSLSGTGQDFTMVGSAPTSVTPGQTATYTVTLTPEGGLNQAISFACSGAPSESTCSVSPASVTPTGPTSIKLTINTTAASAVAPSTRSLPPIDGGTVRWLLLGLIGLAGLMSMARRNPHAIRLRPALVSIAMLVVLALGMVACGGGSSAPASNSNPGTPAGTYSVTVTGTAISGSVTVTHSAVLTLGVK